MLAYQYTPPESSKTIPEVVVEREAQMEDDSESDSTAESSKSAPATTSQDDDNALYILQPRTYTPIPPAPIPSPRISAAPPTTPTPRITAALRGTPDELSIHIEAEEDLPLAEAVRETVIVVPQAGERSATSLSSHPRPLHITKPVHRQSRSSDKEVAPLGHKTSLRDRVSLKIELPTAIHVPPVNALELQRLRYPTPQQSPHSYRPPGSAPSHETERNTYHGNPKHHTTNDFSPPSFPSLIPSPASERQHFRPVQASPHSPLQQRPHTAGTVVNRSGGHHRNAPSQMGMSMLSNVTTMTQENTAAGSTRTVKKKRSAFGWLKKAFSLDEEERAAFEARKRQQPVNFYQAYDGQSPRYLDGKRIP